MSELIPLKCCVLSLSTPLYHNFISGKQPGMFTLVCLICPKASETDSPSASIPPSPPVTLLVSYAPLILASRRPRCFIMLNRLHHPACSSPSHVLHKFNSSRTWTTLPLQERKTFCWSAVQSNYLGMPHCKTYSITSRTRSYYKPHSTHSDTVSTLLTPSP